MPLIKINSLFFGHYTINDHFQNNQPLENFAYDVVRGYDDFEPLLVKNIWGKRFVVDGNRRLFVLREIMDYLDDDRVEVTYTNRYQDRVLVDFHDGYDVEVRRRGTQYVRSAIQNAAREAAEENDYDYYPY